jgi:hypothetical protein
MALTRPDHVPAELVRHFDHVTGAEFAVDPPRSAPPAATAPSGARTTGATGC